MTCLGCIGMLIATIILFHINPILGFLWIVAALWFAEKEEQQEQDKEQSLKQKEEELGQKGTTLTEDDLPICYSPPRRVPPPKPGPPPKIQDP